MEWKVRLKKSICEILFNIIICIIRTNCYILLIMFDPAPSSLRRFGEIPTQQASLAERQGCRTPEPNPPPAVPPAHDSRSRPFRPSPPPLVPPLRGHRVRSVLSSRSRARPPPSQAQRPPSAPLGPSGAVACSCHSPPPPWPATRACSPR
jgi:hypothetical protein